MGQECKRKTKNLILVSWSHFVDFLPIPRLHLKTCLTLSVFFCSSSYIYIFAYCSCSVWRAVIRRSRSWGDSSSSWAACWYRLADVRKQVGVTCQLLDIYPIFLPICQATPNKCLKDNERQGENRYQKWKLVLSPFCKGKKLAALAKTNQICMLTKCYSKLKL